VQGRQGMCSMPEAVPPPQRVVDAASAQQAEASRTPEGARRAVAYAEGSREHGSCLCAGMGKWRLGSAEPRETSARSRHTPNKRACSRHARLIQEESRAFSKRQENNAEQGTHAQRMASFVAANPVKKEENPRPGA